MLVTGRWNGQDPGCEGGFDDRCNLVLGHQARGAGRTGSGETEGVKC